MTPQTAQPTRSKALEEAKKALREKLEDDILNHYEQRDRNEAWWRQVSPAAVALLTK